MPRNPTSPFAALHHGRFITGPTNLKTAKNVGKVPRVGLFCPSNAGSYYMVVYRALSASVCLFIEGKLYNTLLHLLTKSARGICIKHYATFVFDSKAILILLKKHLSRRNFIILSRNDM